MRAIKLLDISMLILGAMDELRRHGHIAEEGMGATARGLARYDQIMASSWRPTEQEMCNGLNLLCDTFNNSMDGDSRDNLLRMIWKWVHHGFDEQKIGRL